MEKIDQDTVDKLQLMAPRTSRSDSKAAHGLVVSGQVFASCTAVERTAIWARLERFDGLVPSLYTFFEDFKYLESCAHCIKRLFGASKGSIHATMKQMFVAPPDMRDNCLIQTSESTFRRARMDSAECFNLGYRQIWLSAMRHYHLMPPDPKSHDKLLAKPNCATADVRVVYEMAQLARSLEFHSPEIQELVNGSPDRQIARAALLQARKPGQFRYDDLDALEDRIMECFLTAVQAQTETACEFLTDSSVKPRARCGLPKMQTHKQDTPFLFIDHLHSEKLPVTNTVTTFFVRRCVYFAFFGKPSTFHPIDHYSGRDLSPGGMTSDTYEQPLAALHEAPTYSRCAFTESSLSAELSDVDMQNRNCMKLGFVETDLSTLQPAESHAMGLEAVERHSEPALCLENEMVISGIDSESASAGSPPDQETLQEQEILKQQRMTLGVPESLERQVQLACLQDH